jgi:hypothetical protein
LQYGIFSAVTSVIHLDLIPAFLASIKDFRIRSFSITNAGRVLSTQASILFLVLEANCSTVLITLSLPWNISVFSKLVAVVEAEDELDDKNYYYIENRANL